MVKQLGVPTIFLTLSSADLKWDEVVFIINKLHKLDHSGEDIENWSYHDRCRLLNSNAVLVARHFYYQVFFKEIAVDGSFGKIKYHDIHVKFQVRCLPNVHCFHLVANVAVLTLCSNKEYGKSSSKHPLSFKHLPPINTLPKIRKSLWTPPSFKSPLLLTSYKRRLLLYSFTSFSAVLY